MIKGNPIQRYSGLRFLPLAVLLCAFFIPVSARAFVVDGYSGNYRSKMVAAQADLAVDWSHAMTTLIGETIIFFLMAYVLGRGVLNSGWNVNYTRKILQFNMFFVPILLSAFVSAVGENSILPSPFVERVAIPAYSAVINLGYDQHLLLILLFGVGVLLWTLPFSTFLRVRSKFLATAFASLDRPEDEGKTLVWLRTEIIATYAVVLLGVWILYNGIGLWSSREFTTIREFLFTAVFISTVGDAIAGIVGTKYGKRSYKVKALFTRKTYTRTLEGSACIFLSAVFIVTYIYIGQPHFLPLLVSVPLLSTLAEMKSPHSWDGPFIFIGVFLAPLAVALGALSVQVLINLPLF